MATSDPWITLGRGYEDSLRIVSDATREVYVAKAHGELAGFLILSMTGPFVGYVQTLCVHPDHQRRGVGTLLLRFAEERIFRESPNVFLCVSSFNTVAKRLSHRLGYDVVGDLAVSLVRGRYEILLRKTIGRLAGFRSGLTSVRIVFLSNEVDMRAFALPIVCSVLGALLVAAASRPLEELRGFSARAARDERDWEAKLQAIPSSDSMRSYMRRLSARPHHVGSPYDKTNAAWLLAQFKEWGWQAQIETFDVLFPTPRERVVELVAPTRFVAKLQEPPVTGDPTSGQQSEQLPTYNAYSADGDVTGPLVYVNYGVPADYEQLERVGVSVKGAIVIARYGGSWRGIKPKVAAEHGAVGCLIYSDPPDDGYRPGDVYPQGPWRPRDGLQRGSVADMPRYPGDPLTPGVGATPGAKRLSLAEAQTITKIPVLPISYGDAQPLLAALRGPMAPDAWRGALPLTYRIGPGPAKVHLRVKSDWSTKPLYDVIARLPGASAADQWIMRGNHHDAWVNGAQDAISGLVPLLEEARALGQLARQGWN